MKVKSIVGAALLLALGLFSLTLTAGELFPQDTDKSKCVYTDRVQKMPRLRGVMSPSGKIKEDDLKTLGRWGANLLRYQIVRGWNERNNNQDRAEYLNWVDSKITHLLNDVLPWANAAGVQVIVDLHVAPGGRDQTGDMNMFYDRRHADTFLMAWTNIATRCAGRKGICGYDLINEPCQRRPSPKDCDLLTLQERAAKLVREIDSSTPIIVESNGWDSPKEFHCMCVFKMKDVIYQAHMYQPMAFTHQGVPGVGQSAPTRYPDSSKGWDKDYLRRQLAEVRAFQVTHGARIYIGEFSAIAWADGAEAYLRDVNSLCEEYGWDWSYHAFREWQGWSVEHEGPDANHLKPSADNPRKRALLDGLSGL